MTREALIVVDWQTQFVHNDTEWNKAVNNSRKLIQAAHNRGIHIVSLEFKGCGPLITPVAELFSFIPHTRILKNSFGGGFEVVRRLPELRKAWLCGIYATQCVMSTGIELAKEGVETKLVGKACYSGLSFSQTQQVYEQVLSSRRIPATMLDLRVR